jgi:hypothetical protein
MTFTQSDRKRQRLWKHRHTLKRETDCRKGLFPPRTYNCKYTSLLHQLWTVSVKGSEFFRQFKLSNISKTKKAPLESLEEDSISLHLITRWLRSGAEKSKKGTQLRTVDFSFESFSPARCGNNFTATTLVPAAPCTFPGSIWRCNSRMAVPSEILKKLLPPSHRSNLRPMSCLTCDVPEIYCNV